MKQNNVKETYERSALTVTHFSSEDVITTSGGLLASLMSLFGREDETNFPAGTGSDVFQNR